MKKYEWRMNYHYYFDDKERSKSNVFSDYIMGRKKSKFNIE
jgi:hypothetical protein